MTSIDDKETVEEVKYLIENNLVDTVDLGRPVLADPEFANKAISGQPINKCTVVRHASLVHLLSTSVLMVIFNLSLPEYKLPLQIYYNLLEAQGLLHSFHTTTGLVKAS